LGVPTYEQLYAFYTGSEGTRMEVGPQLLKMTDRETMRDFCGENLDIFEDIGVQFKPKLRVSETLEKMTATCTDCISVGGEWRNVNCDNYYCQSLRNKNKNFRYKIFLCNDCGLYSNSRDCECKRGFQTLSKDGLRIVNHDTGRLYTDGIDKNSESVYKKLNRAKSAEGSYNQYGNENIYVDIEDIPHPIYKLPIEYGESDNALDVAMDLVYSKSNYGIHFYRGFRIIYTATSIDVHCSLYMHEIDMIIDKSFEENSDLHILYEMLGLGPQFFDVLYRDEDGICSSKYPGYKCGISVVALVSLFYKPLMNGGYNPYGNENKITYKKFHAKMKRKDPNMPDAAILKRWNIKQHFKSIDRRPVQKPMRKRQASVAHNTPGSNKGTFAKRPIRGPYQRGIGDTGTPVQIPRGKSGQVVHYSRCVYSYATFLINPFIALGENPAYIKGFKRIYGEDVHDHLPCIPTFPCVNSFKFICIQRGSIVIGANGGGFIAIAPFRPANNYTVTGDALAPIAISTTGYLGTASFPTLDTGAVPAAGVLMQNWISPFSVGDVNTVDKKFRVTFCGVRVTCSGALLNVSGDYEKISITGSFIVEWYKCYSIFNQSRFLYKDYIEGKRLGSTGLDAC